jgi:hypothetical protein
MKHEIKLNRTGERAIAFMGEEIAIASTRDTSEETKTRWHTVRVFETDHGYNVGLAFVTLWEGERDNYQVLKAKTKQQVLGIVRMHIPALDQAIADKLGIRNGPIGRLEHESSRSPVES